MNVQVAKRRKNQILESRPARDTEGEGSFQNQARSPGGLAMGGRPCVACARSIAGPNGNTANN